MTTLVHLSDLHFGGMADIRAVEAVEELLPALKPAAIVISGDFAQRARAGEFQRARAFLRAAQRIAPVQTVAGNHDVQWWREPFGIPLLGRARFAKYRRYVADDLAPSVSVDGAVICGAASAHGLALGSVTWNPRDLTVKGHLPEAELSRAAAVVRGAQRGRGAAGAGGAPQRAQGPHFRGAGDWRTRWRRGAASWPRAPTWSAAGTITRKASAPSSWTAGA